MNTKELFLKCCQAHQWTPLHIHSDEIDSKSIDEEAKEALNQGRAELCLDLIELAKTMNLQSTTQLELKAISLTQSYRKKSKGNHKRISERLPLGELVQKLLKNCQDQNWQPQFLQTAASTNNRADIEQMILKEAETARDADRADISLDLINTTLEVGFSSLWLHHLKARALQKTGKLEEAIEIWEKLSTQEIEGFSENVRSALKIAKTELTLSHAQQQEASGHLDASIEVLASALLNNPDESIIETTIKRMLRKRRNTNNPKDKGPQLDEHLDEIDLNQAFLSQVEALLASNTPLTHETP